MKYIVAVPSLAIRGGGSEELERQQAVKVYTKLPRGFYINTPVGKYNPNWAIVRQYKALLQDYWGALAGENTSYHPVRRIPPAACSEEDRRGVGCF